MRILRFFPVVCLLLFSGCARETPAPSTPVAPIATAAQKFPKDDLGREVNLKSFAKRVVCIGPGATETIFALGAGAQLVGRDQVSDYPAAALKIPIVGDYTGPFIEKVIALKPDLVIVQGETYDRARAENWQAKIGAPVAILVPTSMKKVGYGIQKVGAWLGPRQQANKLSEPFTFGGPSWASSAFFEIQRTPLWTAGEGTLVESLMQASALSNVIRIRGYKQVNNEKLLTEQPEIYVVPGNPSEKVKILKDLREHPVLGKLKCVREGSVVVVNSDLVLRPGPRLLEGVGELYSASKKYSTKKMNADRN